MSKHDDLDLSQIDALLDEESEEVSVDEEVMGDDDFAALLGADDSEEDSFEEDSLDDVLGAIDNSFLTAEEQVFLKNKSFLDSHNPVELDKFFMEYTETLYGAMCEYGGTGEDEFGAEDELEEMCFEAEMMSGHCFGSDEEAEAFVHEAAMNGYCEPLTDGAEFGAVGIAAAGIAAGVATGNIGMTRKRYMKEISKLEKCVKRFNKIAEKLDDEGSIKLVAGQNQFVRKPFTTLVIATENDPAKLQKIMEGKNAKAKSRRLSRVAERCDNRLIQLREVYRKLAAKGKASGLKKPAAVFNDILNTLTKKSKKASKKAGGIVKAVTAASGLAVATRNKAKVRRKKVAELARVRTADMNAKRKERRESAKEKLKAARQSLADKRANRKAGRKLESTKRGLKRADRKESRIAKREERKTLRETRREERKSARLSRRQERKMAAAEKKMVEENPYMDAADLKALGMARKSRMAKPAPKKPSMFDRMRNMMPKRKPAPVKSKPVSVRRPAPSPVRGPTVSAAQPRVSALSTILASKEKELSKLEREYARYQADQMRYRKPPGYKKPTHIVAIENKITLLKTEIAQLKRR